MKVVFLGTGVLGLPTLQALANSSYYEILAVFTQPDRPAGRGLHLHPSPVKVLTEKLHLHLCQPEKINREVGMIRQLQPDAIVVAAYGQILSAELLSIPRLGSINLHASLLPRYRGAAPIPWALIHQETVTGVTTFLMDEGLDTGPILLQRELPIAAEDTSGSLEKRLAELGASVMLDTLQGLERAKLTPQPQDDSRASHAPKIKKERAKIDWTKRARELFHLIRALNPAPGAFTFHNGKRLKVHRSRVMDDSGTTRNPGEVIGFSQAGVIVQAGHGTLELVEVQPEGKKSMPGIDFVHGHPIAIGEKLG